MAVNSIDEIIEDIRAGKMVIMMDDEDRENEGDLIMAANCVRPEDINFMARYGRGLICLTLTQERCSRLRLPLMVSETHTKHLTNFTVSVDAARGITTGISAADRATTILAAADPQAEPSDLVQPGHIFPLMAQPGGVLARAGHTEAGCDLAQLAGFEPAGVIVEILSDDGSMARRPELEQFAQDHDIKIGTVADLIRFRLEQEKTVECVAQSKLRTDYGMFDLRAYRDSATGLTHLALVHGSPDPSQPVYVRVHMEDMIGDLLSSSEREGTWSLHSAMRYISDKRQGAIVILRTAHGDQGLIHRIEDLSRREQAQEGSAKTPLTSDLRTYGVGAQILVDLGIRKMLVLGSPIKLLAISGFGLEIVDYIPSRY